MTPLSLMVLSLGFTSALLCAAIGFPYVPWWGNLLFALWMWLLGANIGSFMNVVVHRMPLGHSVVHPRSRCPRCMRPIEWYDNVPVLSWCILRARCRNCSLPISSRYPTVEALVGCVFLTLALAAPVTTGENLPQLAGITPLRSQTQLTLWLMFGVHLLCLCTLICAALIRYDRQSPPWQLFAPALLVGLTAPLVWPELRPVPFVTPLDMNDRWAALVDGFAGLAVGGALGSFVFLTSKASARSKAAIRSAVCRMATDDSAQDQKASGYHPLSLGEIPVIMLCGLVLGWQAACAIACFAAVAHLITLLLARWQPWFERVPWTAHLSTGVLLYVTCWGRLVENAAWLGPRATMATFAWTALGLTVVNLATAALRSAESDKESLHRHPGDASMPADERLHAILNSPSYRLAELDTDFLQREELRPIRLQLELLKPEMALAEQQVKSTIVAFGGTQIVERQAAEQRLEVARAALDDAPHDALRQRQVRRAERILEKTEYYDAAREFAQLVSSRCQRDHCDFVITTGGGPGIMEAANRGAADAGGKSIGLNITLPHEQAPNPYITPELCFQFHYFALRKMHFLFRAKALVVFPGGFGTLDELFDALTLRQTNRMQAIPIILFGRQYWNRVIDFQFLADEGVIRDEHLDLLNYAETAEEAWKIIASFHGIEP